MPTLDCIRHTNDHAEEAGNVNVSPWMTRTQAATYTHRNRETIRRACVDYDRSGGKSGLKHSSRVPGGRLFIHVDDADRWMRGEVPAPVKVNQ